MTISKAIIQALDPIPDGNRFHAGAVYDKVKEILVSNGEKRVSECSIKRTLARLHICVSINNSPQHPSDMRLMDRSGAYLVTMERAKQYER